MRLSRIVTAEVDPANIAAGAVLNVDVNVAGLNLGQAVIPQPPIALEAGLVPITAEVVDSGAGALRIRQRIFNPTAAGIDGAARRWSWLLVEEGE